MTQQPRWLDEISKLWELPKLFKIYIFSFLGTLLAIFLVYISLSPLPKVVLVLTGSQCPPLLPFCYTKTLCCHISFSPFPLSARCLLLPKMNWNVEKIILRPKRQTKSSTTETNNEAEEEYHTKNVSDLFRLYTIHIRPLCQSRVVINFEDKCWYKLWTNLYKVIINFCSPLPPALPE